MDDDPEYVGSFSRTVAGRVIDISTWPTPDEGALVGDSRARYFARKNAVKMYLKHCSDQIIKADTGLSSKQAYRLIGERCLATHSDGQIYGFRGLIPNQRIRPYKRRKKIVIDQFGSGGSGAMQALLDSNPDLRLDLEKRIRKIPKGKKLAEIHVSYQEHCSWFLDKLRARGYELRNEWPFNTDSTAYYSVRRYVKDLLSSYPEALAAAAGGPEMIRKMKSGDGRERPVTRFLERVEMDAHKLDGRFCVSIPQIGGGSIERIVYRLWVTVIVEVTSRLVLGYYFSMGKEVNAEDVLRTIKRALSKARLREIVFAKEPYVHGAGFLSMQGEKFIGLCWDETSVDGALAETCKRIEGALRETVGAVLLTPENSFAKRRSLDDRPFIETFFRRLAGNGFQRLTNTTGANTTERKGREPEKVALQSRFQYEFAEELLDVLVANYNGLPHSGIGRRSPLIHAKYLFEQSGTPARYADLNTVNSLLSMRKLCRVRGGAEEGRKPFVEFSGARYSNQVLQNRQDLVGQYIWVTNHLEDDARTALISTQVGTSLGVVHASPPWHLSPHSLKLRRAIQQAERRGKFVVPNAGDGVQTFINYVESQPNNKLPIHPAYLEARRVLTAAADAFVGDALLKAALESANEDTDLTPQPSESLL